MQVNNEERAGVRDSIGMEFVPIPAGAFWMGSAEDERGSWAGERPRHEVRISRPFYLGRYPVTQEQWRQVMGRDPSLFRDSPALPVEHISWYDALDFIRELNRREEGRGSHRLPTEAEWEYACRAGSTTRWSFGDDEAALGGHAWFAGNSEGRSRPVGGKRPNAWGLHDMHGNVWEWLADWWRPGYEPLASPVVDPQGPGEGNFRVIRGGSCDSNPQFCRSAQRDAIKPETRFYMIGLRLVFSPGPETPRDVGLVD